jgi:hypothetical protein
MSRQYTRPRGMDGQLLDVVFYEENNEIVSVPFDQNNIDYQAYLEWVAEGNQPIIPPEEQA